MQSYLPPWAAAINVPDEELDEDLYNDDEVHEHETYYLTQNVFRTILGLAAIGLGTIAYALGKAAERLLDN